MILHIFTRVSDYSAEFMALLTEKFQGEDHILIFRNSNNRHLIEGKFPFRIFFLVDRKDLIEQMPGLMARSEKILFHSFPVSRSLLFWFRYRKYFNKAIWCVWGQDAYWYRYCRKTPANRMYEYLRKRLIKKLNIILCPIEGDFEFIQKNYKTSAIYHPAMYPIPTDFRFLKTLRNTEKKIKELTIQVGNSSNPTNNTLEVLSFLKNHLDTRFRVFCPLSYGDEQYAQQIIEYGTRALGDRFTALTDFLDKNEYARFISSVDVLIMNHNRQQGLGNIFSYLFLGKKVYIRKDNSSFRFFNNNNIKVYDTTELIGMDLFGQLFAHDKTTASGNIARTEELISLDKISRDWKPILTSNFSND
jgi:hypothetical protein